MEAWLSGLAQITHEPAVVAIPVKLKEEGFTCKRKRKRMVRQQAIDLTGNETLGVTQTESGVEDVATSQARPTSDVVATPNLVQWNALHLGRLVQEMIGAKEVCYRYKNELSWLSGQVAPRPDGSGSGDSSRSSQSVRAACICNMNSLLAYGYLREHLEHSPMVAMETHRPATRAYELLHDWYKARAFVHGGFVTSSQDHYQAGHPKVIHVDDSVGTQQCEAVVSEASPVQDSKRDLNPVATINAASVAWSAWLNRRVRVARVTTNLSYATCRTKWWRNYGAGASRVMAA